VSELLGAGEGSARARLVMSVHGQGPCVTGGAGVFRGDRFEALHTRGQASRVIQALGELAAQVEEVGTRSLLLFDVGEGLIHCRDVFGARRSGSGQDQRQVTDVVRHRRPRAAQRRTTRAHRAVEILGQAAGFAELTMSERLLGHGRHDGLVVLRTPVRTLSIASTSTGLKVGLVSAALIDAEVYGEHPVMTRGGVVTGVPVGEPEAWCVVKPTNEVDLAVADEFLSANASPSGPVPYCPEGAALMEPAAIKRYTLRGAMNAGMAAFVYLDAVSRGEIEPNLQYDECHLLK